MNSFALADRADEAAASGRYEDALALYDDAIKKFSGLEDDDDFDWPTAWRGKRMLVEYLREKGCIMIRTNRQPPVQPNLVN